MTSALVTAVQSAGLHHYTGPWYVIIPVAAIGVGLRVWMRRRGGGGGGRGPSGGSGNS
jgi:hypothetical protein